MRIAVLVHSAVKNDARITKQAMSLRAAGHEVVIHGIAPGRDHIATTLPGSDVPVLLEPRIGRLAQLRKRCLQSGDAVGQRHYLGFAVVSIRTRLCSRVMPLTSAASCRTG